MRARVLSEEDRDSYDAFVAGSDHGDLLQSWAWGEVKRSGGWTPRRYVVEDGGRIVASAGVLRTRPVRGAPALLYAPRGPVLARPAALAPLVEAIRADAHGAFVLKCDPAIEAGAPEADALRAAGFRGAGGGGFGGVQPRAVMVLDLDADEDKILEGFKPKWRYNIRLAERRGVVVSPAGRDDLAVFHDLLLETARRDGFFVRGRAYFERLWDVLAPREGLGMWLARFEGRPVAGAIAFAFGRRVTYVYGASSNRDRQVMPNHLVQWTMIRWARSRGASVYDFRGVSPVRDGRPLEPAIAGLNRFKEGFGARYVEYAGDLDLPLRPLAWRLWTAGAPAAMRLYKRLKGGAAAAAD